MERDGERERERENQSRWSAVVDIELSGLSLDWCDY